jgi:hypothetical protein
MDLHWQILGVTRTTDSQIITQSGIFFLLQNKLFFVARTIEKLFCNKKKLFQQQQFFFQQ